jgi:hypothetical protein
MITLTCYHDRFIMLSDDIIMLPFQGYHVVMITFSCYRDIIIMLSRQNYHVIVTSLSCYSIIISCHNRDIVIILSYFFSWKLHTLVLVLLYCIFLYIHAEKITFNFEIIMVELFRGLIMQITKNSFSIEKNDFLIIPPRIMLPIF